MEGTAKVFVSREWEGEIDTKYRTVLVNILLSSDHYSIITHNYL